MKIGEAVQQGEVYIKRVAELKTGEFKEKKKDHQLGFILAHSESGHHHILTGGEVLEMPEDKGLKRFMATITNTEKLIQDAANPHKTQELPAGFYEIRISREYNPFLQQARQVQD